MPFDHLKLTSCLKQEGYCQSNGTSSFKDLKLCFIQTITSLTLGIPVHKIESFHLRKHINCIMIAILVMIQEYSTTERCIA